MNSDLGRSDSKIGTFKRHFLNSRPGIMLAARSLFCCLVGTAYSDDLSPAQGSLIEGMPEMQYLFHCHKCISNAGESVSKTYFAYHLTHVFGPFGLDSHYTNSEKPYEGDSVYVLSEIKTPSLVGLMRIDFASTWRSTCGVTRSWSYRTGFPPSLTFPSVEDSLPPRMSDYANFWLPVRCFGLALQPVHPFMVNAWLTRRYGGGTNIGTK